MSKPFSQLVEDAMDRARESADEVGKVRAKYRRLVNEIYREDIPERHEFDWYKSTAQIKMIPAYSTGTVDVNSGSTTVSGGDTSPSWTTEMTGRKITLGGNDEIYVFTHASATSGTIDRAFTDTGDLDEGTYQIYEDTYSLPSDFDRPYNYEDAVYFDQSGGGRVGVKWSADGDWGSFFSTTPTTHPSRWRIHPDRDADGLMQIQVTPPPSQERYLNVEYVTVPDEMEEYQATDAVTITLSNRKEARIESVDVTFFAKRGRYFRHDNSRVWRRITGVAYDGQDTVLHLDSDYPIGTALSSDSNGYTLCDTPEMIPPASQKALISGALWIASLEKNSPTREQWLAKYIRDLGSSLAKHSRRRYGSRYMRVRAPGSR